MKRWYRFRGSLVVAETERTGTHTHTHEPSTVTLAAHARRGLIMFRTDAQPVDRMLNVFY